MILNSVDVAGVDVCLVDVPVVLIKYAILPPTALSVSPLSPRQGDIPKRAVKANGNPTYRGK